MIINANVLDAEKSGQLVSKHILVEQMNVYLYNKSVNKKFMRIVYDIRTQHL